MATSNHYPSTVLLDNENNPITPLVDVASIYVDPQTKEDAQVLVGPMTEEFSTNELNVDEAGNVVNADGDDLYLITEIKIVDRQIVYQKVKATELLELWSENDIWEALEDSDSTPLEDTDSVKLQARKY